MANKSVLSPRGRWWYPLKFKEWCKESGRIQVCYYVTKIVDGYRVRSLPEWFKQENENMLEQAFAIWKRWEDSLDYIKFGR